MKIVYRPNSGHTTWAHEHRSRKLAWALRNGDEFLGFNPDGTQKRLISDYMLQQAIKVVLAEPQLLKEIDRLHKARAGAVAEARRWKAIAEGRKG